jgi:hypothetical protein
MKKVFIAALCATVGLLLPTQSITAKSSIKGHAHTRIIEVVVDGDALQAHSESTDGPITRIRIYDLKGSGTPVIDQSFSSYSATVNISSIGYGSFMAKVDCA